MCPCVNNDVYGTRIAKQSLITSRDGRIEVLAWCMNVLYNIFYRGGYMLKRTGLAFIALGLSLALTACDSYTVNNYDDPSVPVTSSNAANRDQVCATLAKELGYYGHNNYEDLHENDPAMYKKVQSFKAHGCDK